jgi:hypothetical protein
MTRSVGKLKFGFNVVSSAAKPRLAKQPGSHTSRFPQLYNTAELGGWPMARFHFACDNFFTCVIQLWLDVYNSISASIGLLESTSRWVKLG